MNPFPLTNQADALVPKPIGRFIGIEGLLQSLGLYEATPSSDRRRKIRSRWDHPG